MNILMVSSECFPYAKTGGLADAVASLSIALSKLGHNVKIIMPRYYKIDRSKLSLTAQNVWVDIGSGEIQGALYESTLPNSTVSVYFFDYEKCFGRAGIYGENNGDYGDNPFRSSAFCRAAFALCKVLNFSPDIIHAHDWFSALTTVLLKFIYKRRGSIFEKTHSVLTIHNMGYQGQYGGGAFGALGLPAELLYPSGLEQYNTINFLKAGITSSDFITTVSPNYAREIQTGSGGFGLDGLMRVRSNCLTGILNGADTSQWDPATDKLLPANYGNSLAGKATCKAQLQKQFGLPLDSSVPIIAMIGRLAQQKGIAEIFGPMYGCAYDIATKLRVQFIVLGSGEAWAESEIQNLSGRLPNMACYIGYSEKLSHLIEAGADYFLMPSLYEPCGLNQIYSMLYGTPPIVHHTGGLADTVINVDAPNPTGFVYYDQSPAAIFGTVKGAIDTYYENNALYKRMQQNGMKAKFSWEDAAKKYLAVYKDT